MKQHKKIKNLIRLIAIFSIALLAQTSLQGNHPIGLSAVKAANETEGPFSVKLPFMVSSSPYQGVFGVELGVLGPSHGLDTITTAGPSWVRRNGLLWSQVETAPGQRNWNSALGAELIQASQKNLEVILVVRSTPTWAQKVSGSSCGPIKETDLGAFAQFMRDAVSLYSKPPYNVKYWEIWNEPDVPGSIEDIPFGCWGDYGQTTFGGEYYGQMLKTVYPAIKAANADAQVLIGGLLLDCNPTIPNACTDPFPPLFLTGIFNAGAGDYFDGISFHAYDYYLGQLGRFGNMGWNSSWNTTGPVFLEKANYLQSILAARGYANKYLINTESAMIVSSGGCDDTCQETKAYYVAQAYGTAIAAQLKANIWFSAKGWRQSGLLNPTTLEPYKAYHAFAFARLKLNGATLVRKVEEFPGVFGYEFKKGSHRIWLLWSKDGSSHAITLSGAPQAVWDALGASQAVSGANLTITIKPLYIEW
jgi:hypothetical protein